MVGPGLDDIERTQFSFDFDLERQLLADGERRDASLSQQNSTSGQVLLAAVVTGTQSAAPVSCHHFAAKTGPKLCHKAWPQLA